MHSFWRYGDPAYEDDAVRRELGFAFARRLSSAHD